MNQTATTRLEGQIAALWERNLPTLRERLDLLDRVAASTADGSLTHDDMMAARDVAHKLAGLLGTFGYPLGSDIARKLELLLVAPLPTQPDYLTRLTTELRQSIFLNE
jgi:hypothetical protein